MIGQQSKSKMLTLHPSKMRHKMLVSTIRYNVIGQQSKSNMLRLHPLKRRQKKMLVSTIRYNFDNFC